MVDDSRDWKAVKIIVEKMSKIGIVKSVERNALDIPLTDYIKQRVSY